MSCVSFRYGISLAKFSKFIISCSFIHLHVIVLNKFNKRGMSSPDSLYIITRLSRPLNLKNSKYNVSACMYAASAFLYVLHDFRQLGLGQNLLDIAINFAKGIVYSRIVLDSSKALHAARALCLKNGFVDILRYNNNYRADVFMERRLT